MKIRKLKKFSVNATLLLFTFFYFLTSVVHPVYADGEINPVDVIKYGKIPKNPSPSGDAAKENYTPKEKSDTWGVGKDDSGNDNLGGDLTPEERQQKLRENWWKKVEDNKNSDQYKQYKEFKKALEEFTNKYKFDYGQGGYMSPDWWPWWWAYNPQLNDEVNNGWFIKARDDAQKISRELDNIYSKADALRSSPAILDDGMDIKTSSIVPVLAANLKETLDKKKDYVIPTGIIVDKGGYDPQAVAEENEGVATQLANNYLSDQSHQPDWFERIISGAIIALIKFIYWVLGVQDIMKLVFHSDEIYGSSNINSNSGLPSKLWILVNMINLGVKQQFVIPIVIMLTLTGVVVLFRIGSPNSLLMLKDQIIKSVGVMALLFFGSDILLMIFKFIDLILYIIQWVAENVLKLQTDLTFVEILFGTAADGTDPFDNFTKKTASFVVALLALLFIVFNAIYTVQYTLRIFWMTYHLAAFPFILVAALQPGKKGIINQWLSDFLGHALLPVYHGIVILPFMWILQQIISLSEKGNLNSITPVAGPGAAVITIAILFFTLLKAPRFMHGLFSSMFSGGEAYHRLDSAAAGTARTMIGGAIGYGIGRIRNRFPKGEDSRQEMPGRNDGSVRNPGRKGDGWSSSPARKSDTSGKGEQRWEEAYKTTGDKTTGSSAYGNRSGYGVTEAGEQQTLQPTSLTVQQEKNLSAAEQTQSGSVSQEGSTSKGKSLGGILLRGAGYAVKAAAKGAYFAGRKFTKYGIAFTTAAAATAANAMLTGEVNTGTFQRVFRSSHTAMTNASMKYRRPVEKALGTAAKATGVAMGQAWNKVRGKVSHSPQEDSPTNTSAQSKEGNFGQETDGSRYKTVEGGVPLRNEKTFQSTEQAAEQTKQENQDQENAGEIRVLTPEESKAIRESGKVIDTEKASDTYFMKQDKKIGR